MFYKHKSLFFIIQFIFCVLLFHFIEQQIVLVGVLKYFVVDWLTIFFFVMIVSYLLSKIITQFYIIFGKLIRFKVHKRFTFWLLFTLLCYALDFVIFAVAIEY